MTSRDRKHLQNAGRAALESPLMRSTSSLIEQDAPIDRPPLKTSTSTPLGTTAPARRQSHGLKATSGGTRGSSGSIPTSTSLPLRPPGSQNSFRTSPPGTPLSHRSQHESTSSKAAPRGGVRASERQASGRSGSGFLAAAGGVNTRTPSEAGIPRGVPTKSAPLGAPTRDRNGPPRLASSGLGPVRLNADTRISSGSGGREHHGGVKRASSRILSKPGGAGGSETSSARKDNEEKKLSLTEQRDIVQKALSSGGLNGAAGQGQGKRGAGTSLGSHKPTLPRGTAMPKSSLRNGPRNVTAAATAAPPAASPPESDPFEEDDVEYSWPPKPPQRVPAATPPTYEQSGATSPPSSRAESMDAFDGLQSIASRKLFEPPCLPEEPKSEQAEVNRRHGPCAIKSGVDDISIQWARNQFQSRTALKLQFTVVQVMRDKALFESSAMSVASQRVVRAWTQGHCSGEMVALTLLQRPAFFLEDEQCLTALNAMATTPEAICNQICGSREVLASELEVRFLQQESKGDVCSGLWREVVRQALNCPIEGFDANTLVEELSDAPPSGSMERNLFVGRYIYELLQIKRELLNGSSDSAYEVLGLSPDATDEQVRKAYRALCLKHHPDKGGDTAQFLAIQRAYHTIKEMRREERGEQEDGSTMRGEEGEGDDVREEEKGSKNDKKADDGRKKQKRGSTSEDENNSEQEDSEKSSTSSSGWHKKGDTHAEKGSRNNEPHPLVEKLKQCAESVRRVREAAMSSVIAKDLIESLQKTHTLGAVQEATKAAQNAIQLALVVVAEGLGERVAKEVLSIAKQCIDLPESDSATALIVQEGMHMLIKSKSLYESSKALKPVQREIQLTLDTLSANLMISKMLGTMDEETAEMSLRLIAEAGRRAQSALSTVLETSEALEISIEKALLHAQFLNSAPPTRPSSPEFEPMESDDEEEKEKRPPKCAPNVNRAEAIAADQRALLRRLLEEIELLRKPLTKDGLVMAMRLVAESLVSNMPISMKYPFDVPSAAFKAVLHHPEGRLRLTVLFDEMKKLQMRVPDELKSLIGDY